MLKPWKVSPFYMDLVLPNKHSMSHCMILVETPTYGQGKINHLNNIVHIGMRVSIYLHIPILGL